MADPNAMNPGARSGATARSVGAAVSASHGAGSGSRTVAEVKEVGAELIGAVRDGATSLFEEQRDRAASEIAAIGEMLRRSARSLDESRSTAVAHYAEDAAGGITRFADRLRGRSLGMMADDAENFARRLPIAFMALAIGAGFLAGRFLVSSASRPAAETMTQPLSHPGTTMGEPIGGAHHDSGTLGGAAPGGANPGYDIGGTREAR